MCGIISDVLFRFFLVRVKNCHIRISYYGVVVFCLFINVFSLFPVMNCFRFWVILTLYQFSICELQRVSLVFHQTPPLLSECSFLLYYFFKRNIFNIKWYFYIKSNILFRKFQQPSSWKIKFRYFILYINDLCLCSFQIYHFSCVNTSGF